MVGTKNKSFLTKKIKRGGMFGLQYAKMGLQHAKRIGSLVKWEGWMGWPYRVVVDKMTREFNAIKLVKPNGQELWTKLSSHSDPASRGPSNVHIYYLPTNNPVFKQNHLPQIRDANLSYIFTQKPGDPLVHKIYLIENSEKQVDEINEGNTKVIQWQQYNIKEYSKRPHNLVEDGRLRILENREVMEEGTPGSGMKRLLSPLQRAMDGIEVREIDGNVEDDEEDDSYLFIHDLMRATRGVGRGQIEAGGTNYGDKKHKKSRKSRKHRKMRKSRKPRKPKKMRKSKKTRKNRY